MAIAVLGAGMVGSVMALDLAKEHSVTSIDVNKKTCNGTVTKISSMSRTTGYPCTASAHLIAKNIFNEKGVFPPELVGKHKTVFGFVMDYLKEKNLVWNKKNISHHQ